MEEYLNLCSVCKKKFVTEDEKRSVFAKDCILCGAARSIVSISRDMILDSYVKNMIAGFLAVITEAEMDELLDIVEEELSVFEYRTDFFVNFGLQHLNKRVIVLRLHELYNGSRKKIEDNTRPIENMFDSLIVALNYDIETAKMISKNNINETKIISFEMGGFKI